MASAGFASVALLFIALLHLAWGLGLFWPAQDEVGLARAVVGRRGITRMPPPLACVVVAAALFLMALWPLALVGLFPSPLGERLTAFCGAVLVVVFAARGIAAYSTPWRRLVPEEPFATLDRRVYGPLCLLLASCFLFLLLI
ncbi:MAG: DUF3995 domain-containing protein [Beijerinckiaceae bacterium]|nr:DUF3995 domain-containing protein [Beijerinckiaceae bacterium]